MNWYSTATSKAEEDTTTYEKPQAHHLAKSDPENTVGNLHGQNKRKDQQTFVPITECIQKIQKYHRCNMGPQGDGC